MLASPTLTTDVSSWLVNAPNATTPPSRNADTVPAGARCVTRRVRSVDKGEATESHSVGEPYVGLANAISQRWAVQHRTGIGCGVGSTNRMVRLVPPRRLWWRTSWLLSQAAGRAYRLVVDNTGGPGGRTRYAYLAALEEFGPLSQAELGRPLGIDRKEVVGAINELEEHGLALRAPDTHDPRRNAVSITAAGRRELCRLDKALDRAHEALLEPLSSHERDLLDRLLQRLIQHHFGAPGS